MKKLVGILKSFFSFKLRSIPSKDNSNTNNNTGITWVPYATRSDGWIYGWVDANDPLTFKYDLNKSWYHVTVVPAIKSLYYRIANFCGFRTAV